MRSSCAVAILFLLAGCEAEDVVAVATDGGGARADGAVSDYCAGEGPPILVGDGPSGGVCSGEVATRTFRFALCTCEGLVTSHVLRTDSFDASAGPYVEGGRGGSVGVNAEISTSAPLTIGGALWIGGSGLSAAPGADVSIGSELHDAGALEGEAAFTITTHARVGGRVAVGDLSVGGTLTLPAGSELTVSGTQDVGELVRAPVDVAPPCACGADDLVDIAALVQRHRTDNDNVAAGIDPFVLDGYEADTRLELPCGRFHLARIAGRGALTLAVTGRTALFVDGDLALEGPLAVELADGAELDLFVEGNVVAPDDLRLGSPDTPSRVRLYVGGTGTLELSGRSLFAGNLYAPRAELTTSGAVEAWGSIFVRRLAASGGVTIHYDESVLQVGDRCPPREPPTCESCLDCRNQACIDGACGACRTSADCCAPLLCVDGTCVAEPF